MNIIIYARTFAERSVEQQLEACHTFADENGHTIVGEYVEKILSSDAVQRPIFQRMVKDSKKKSIESVLVYHPDIISQDRYERALYKHFLSRNDVTVMSATESVNADANNAMTEAMLEEMAAQYGFTGKQGKSLEELLKSKYDGL